MGKHILNSGLVVSCQAYEGEPLFGASHMAEMAKAAELGGAIGIRTNGTNEVREIKNTVKVPVIGLNKNYYDGCDVYITPTLEDAIAIHEAGADIVAIDGTNRVRPDGKTLQATITELKKRNINVMADISTFEEGVYAAEVGADYISTTLSGYTPYSPQQSNPDIDLVSRLAQAVKVPVVAEGRYSTASEVNRALEAGAHFVVIGTAITRPQNIVEKYVSQIKIKQKKDVFS